MAIHHFTISIWFWLCRLICEKGSGTKEIQQLKYLSMKIQEVASNVASTVNTGIPGTQGHFEIKLPLNNVMVFYDEPVHCDAQVVENTFVNDSK